MQSYKNLTDHELTIPNVGVVPPGGTIQTELELNSPHLHLITNEAPAPSVPTAQPVQAVPEPTKEGEK